MAEREKLIPPGPGHKPADPIEEFKKGRREDPLDLGKFEDVEEDVREHEEEQGE